MPKQYLIVFRDWAGRLVVVPRKNFDTERLHAENYGVYEVRRLYRLMQRQVWLAGRDQVVRVMKTRGITGVRQGRTPFTTMSKQTRVSDR